MMNWEAIAAIANVLGAAGVIATLFYLALQVRQNTRLVSAQSRHALSEFALQMSLFRAQHADRLAKIEAGGPLTDGDRLFAFWTHAQVMLHAETYFHHHTLGLMPDTHWRGYTRFVADYIQSPGFTEAWAQISPAFSEDFAKWLDGQIARGAPTSNT